MAMLFKTAHGVSQARDRRGRAIDLGTYPQLVQSMANSTSTQERNVTAMLEDACILTANSAAIATRADSQPVAHARR